MSMPRRRASAVTIVTAVAVCTALGLSACGAGGGSGPDGKPGGATHVVRTYKGDVRVPDDPRRVVVLDTAELDSALTLGVTPIGATTADTASGFLGYLPEEKVKGITKVGTIGQPNLEKIAGLHPDLILTNGARDAEHYDKLSAIAPTVMTKSTGKEWKKNFLVHAQALGKRQEAKQVVAGYEDHAGQVTHALGGAAKAAAIETNVVRFVEGADTRIYGDGSYIGTILHDVGLGRPPVVDKATAYGGLMLEISPEQLDMADADALFYTSYGPPAKSGEADALDSPLWRHMDVVRSGRAFRVDDELWIQGIGYTAANEILDRIAEKLTPAS
jgi:iron complex transport system substrate-binding protein